MQIEVNLVESGLSIWLLNSTPSKILNTLCNCITEQICFVTNHISIEVFGACGYSALQIIDMK